MMRYLIIKYMIEISLEETGGVIFMETLHVRMLGGFILHYGNEEIILGRNTTAKFVQLLQMVWLEGNKGISKTQIVRYLYEADELSNPNNSFNNLVFQMRRQMEAAGLPKKDYIIKRGKVFIPDPGVPLTIDVLDFNSYIDQARAEKDEDRKYDLYAHAFDLYRGELLPEAGTKTFVVKAGAQLHQKFDEAAKWLGNYTKSRKDYQDMYRIYEKAAKIYPDSDWQAYQIEALISQENYKEAYQLYDTTVRRYTDDMGLPPSDKMLENYRKMSRKLQQPQTELMEIQSSLVENPVSGAYYCSYPSFIDTYHIMQRNMERIGFSAFMLLCTLVDYEGKPISNKEKLEERSRALKESIGSSLRKGDVYTKFSASQYLVLLIGSTREGCDVVARRISKSLKEREGTKADVRYSNVSLSDLSRIVQD